MVSRMDWDKAKKVKPMGPEEVMRRDSLERAAEAWLRDLSLGRVPRPILKVKKVRR